MLRAQCNDDEALEALLLSVQPALLRYLRSVMDDVHADDVLQETLLMVTRKLVWLQQPELFRAWAFRIASRLAFRHLKKQRRSPEESLDESELGEMPALAIDPPSEILQELLTLDSISPASRAVLVLHFQEEMTLPEVAAILQIPLGTVKSRLAYGLAKIRKQLIQDGRLYASRH